MLSPRPRASSHAVPYISDSTPCLTAMGACADADASGFTTLQVRGTDGFVGPLRCSALRQTSASRTPHTSMPRTTPPLRLGDKPVRAGEVTDFASQTNRRPAAPGRAAPMLQGPSVHRSHAARPPGSRGLRGAPGASNSLTAPHRVQGWRLTAGQCAARRPPRLLRRRLRGTPVRECPPTAACRLRAGGRAGRDVGYSPGPNQRP